MKNRANIPFIGLFHQFFGLFASSSTVLLLSTVVAFLWANSPWAATYHYFWHTPFSVGLGQFTIDKPLHFWINDGLMALFFFAVGLEIKRELLVGELSSPKQALFPMIAAIGGMLVPGVLYMLVNPPGSSYFPGWGIPTVTDIAFSLGILSLLGKRVPLALKVFLTALAIVDDVGAVLIIALFYAKEIDWYYLGLTASLFLMLLMLNRFKVQQPLYYLTLGLLLWGAVLFSGVHTTIAGVLLAFTIPAVSRLQNTGTTSEEIQQAPLQTIEHQLQPWVSYAIMPLFALANAGLSIHWQSLAHMFKNPITIGVLLGLILGKQVGITLFTWLFVKIRLITLPNDIRWSHIYGVSWLGGIGFTISLFISDLAFTDNENIAAAKIGIFVASIVSGLGGWLILNSLLPDMETGVKNN